MNSVRVKEIDNSHADTRLELLGFLVFEYSRTQGYMVDAETDFEDIVDGKDVREVTLETPWFVEEMQCEVAQLTGSTFAYILDASITGDLTIQNGSFHLSNLSEARLLRNGKELHYKRDNE